MDIPESLSIGIDIRCPCCNRNVVKSPHSMVDASERNLSQAKKLTVCSHANCKTKIKLTWKPDKRESIHVHYFSTVSN